MTTSVRWVKQDFFSQLDGQTEWRVGGWIQSHPVEHESGASTTSDCCTGWGWPPDDDHPHWVPVQPALPLHFSTCAAVSQAMVRFCFTLPKGGGSYTHHTNSRWELANYNHYNSSYFLLFLLRCCCRMMLWSLFVSVPEWEIVIGRSLALYYCV